MNLVDAKAKGAQNAMLAIARTSRKILRAAAGSTNHCRAFGQDAQRWPLLAPAARHEVCAADVDLKSWAGLPGLNEIFMTLPNCLLEKLAHALQSLALVAEVIHGAHTLR
jgi:hypothetical protein